MNTSTEPPLPPLLLATERLLESLKRLSAADQALQGAFERRLREICANIPVDQTEKLEGPGGLWSSRLSVKVRMLWRRGRHHGNDAVFLVLVGLHDDAYRDGPRVKQDDDLQEIHLAPVEPLSQSAPEPPPVQAPAVQERFWLLEPQSLQPWELALTEDQELLVEEPGPLLLTGSAGSGKTTILAHRAVRMGAGKRVLVLSFHPPLADYTRSLIRRLHPGTPSDHIEVLHFVELLERLYIHSRGRPPAWEEDVLERLRQDGSLRQLPAAYLEAEIRGAIAGRWLAGEPEPSEEQILNGIRGDLSFLQPTERVLLLRAWRGVYRARRAAGRVDRLDAARELATVEGLPQWDLLLVDEAQDLTAVELELLARLVPDPQGWAVAADEFQVVYPSLFRWNRVRDCIHRARRRLGQSAVAVNLHSIHSNHRNPPAIVGLARSILERRVRLCGGDSPRAVTSVVPGTLIPRRTPYTQDLPAEAIGGIAQTVPMTAVLCPDPAVAAEVRAKVQQYLPGFQRAFELSEAKGLEFDVVILLNPFHGPDADAMERASRQGAACALPGGIVEIACNRLYVAVTRSRGALFILEHPQSHPTWQLEGIRDWVDPEPSPQALVSLVQAEFKQAAAQDWAEAALRFEADGKELSAADCWSQGGAYDRAAEIWERLRQWERAAADWERAGKGPDAARCRAELAETRRQWREAALLWEAAGMGVRQRMAEARFLKEEGRHAEAAALFEGLGQLEEAMDAWQQAECWGEVLRLSARDRHPDARIRAMEGLKRWNDAADLAWDLRRYPLVLEIGLRSQDRRLLDRYYQRILGLSNGKDILKAQARRLPASLRVKLAKELKDWRMEAEALREDHHVQQAVERLLPVAQKGDAKNAGESLELLWAWQQEGVPGINRKELALRAFEHAFMLALNGNGADSYLKLTENFCKQVAVPMFPRMALLDLARKYREEYRRPIQDRQAKAQDDLKRLSRELEKYPLARGIRMAMDGDLAGARALWKREEVSGLEALNPMNAAEHLPVLLQSYRRGSNLPPELRRTLKENLEFLRKTGLKGAANTQVEGMLAELRGDTGLAWRILADREPELAAIRHSKASDRRRRMLQKLAVGGSMSPEDISLAIAEADAYAAAEPQDGLSRGALALWRGADMAAALEELRTQNVSPVVPPLGEALVMSLLRGPNLLPLAQQSLDQWNQQKPRSPEPRAPVFLNLICRVLEGTANQEFDDDGLGQSRSGILQDEPMTGELILLLRSEGFFRRKPTDIPRWERLLGAYATYATHPGVRRVVWVAAPALLGEWEAAKREAEALNLEV